MQLTRRNKNQAILFFTMATAVFFHAAVIWGMHGMRMDFDRHGQPRSQQPLNEALSTQQEIERRAELRQRSEELAQIFNQMEPEFEPDLGSASIAEPIPEAVETHVPVNEHLLVQESSLSEHIEQHPNLPMLDEVRSEEPGLVQLDAEIPSPTVPQEILFSNDVQLAHDLRQATSAIEGLLEAEPQEIVTEAHPMQIGKDEESLFTGNAWENRSGLLDQELPIVDQGGKLPKASDTKWQALTGEATDEEKNDRQILNLIEHFAEQTLLLPAKNVDTGREFVVHSLETIASSRDFTLKIDYTFRKDAPGYIFRLTMTPKPEVNFKKIKQNYFFLLDRSHSIPYARYEASKEAVKQSLALLGPADTFNILIFDEKVVRFSPALVPVTQKNVKEAEAFLEKQKHGGMFAATDLYSSLGDIIPTSVPEKEVNTAILFSDGDTFLSLAKQRESIAKWTARNAGKVSLYSLAAGKGNNLALLDLLSTFNRGRLFYAKTDIDIAKTVTGLLEQIRHPIGKDIVATAITPDKDLLITLLPPAECLPNLNEKVPYVLYGSVNKLDDFTVFIQGRYYDKWLDIKHQVSFKDLQSTDSPQLDRSWAMQQSYDLYKKYLTTGQPSILLQIRKILAPFNLPVAFK